MSWAAAKGAARMRLTAVILGRDMGATEDVAMRRRGPTSEPHPASSLTTRRARSYRSTTLGELVDLQALQERGADAVARGRALAGRAEAVLERLDELVVRHAVRRAEVGHTLLQALAAGRNAAAGAVLVTVAGALAVGDPRSHRVEVVCLAGHRLVGLEPLLDRGQQIVQRDALGRREVAQALAVLEALDEVVGGRPEQVRNAREQRRRRGGRGRDACERLGERCRRAGDRVLHGDLTGGGIADTSSVSP